MKHFYRIFVLFPILLAWSSTADAQQLAVSNYQMFQPGLYNPAYIPNSTLNQIYLGHQHRQLADVGWGTISQFLNFKSKALGRSKSFGWGAYIYNDIEHTERRTALGISVAANLVSTDIAYLGVGFSGGLINWASNYSDIPVYHPTDPLVVRASNIAELDAGMGLSFGIETYAVRAQAHATAQQLPGSLLSRDIPGIKLAPHLLSQAHVLFSPIPDVYVGPMAYYRNTFSRDSLVGGIVRGQLDIGFRTDFDRPNFWFGGAYRMDNAAVTAAFGLRIAGTDTNTIGRKSATFLDLNLAASYPLNESAIFGPSIEIGLKLQIGRAGEDVTKIDTLGKMRGSFWVSNGNMNMHKVRQLTPTSPSGLEAETLIGEKLVTLLYNWDDNMYLFSGTQMDTLNDSMVTRLGPEWIGVDNILQNMSREVIVEALTPRSTDVENPDSLEPLKDLLAVGLVARLKVDELAADFGADNGKGGMTYNGELGYDNAFGDSLSMVIRYFDIDTTIVVKRGERLTNMALACLKLEAMQRKLLFELNQVYGESIAFVREGYRPNETGDRKIAYLRHPEVILNNPNQKPFQVSGVVLDFARDPGWVPEVSDNKKRSREKRNANRSGREPRGKRARNQYREEVPDNWD
ncbi:MAG: type IX secretion system membrane protein PorP/SprF [Bacteroidota bacterium]